MNILVQKEGQQIGPFSRETIQSMLDEGQLKHTDLAYYEGLSNWMPVAAVLVPRKAPPPYRKKDENTPAGRSQTIDPDAILKSRPAGNFENRRAWTNVDWLRPFHDLQRIGFATLFPARAALIDKPWNLVWVRWVLLFTFIPFVLNWLLIREAISS